MQRKASVTGSTALFAALAALLAGCTSDSGSDSASDDAKPAGPGASAPPAPPGRYRTLPEPCGQVEQGALNKMLPGIKGISDERQRDQAYQGSATVTYDTDRRVGCRWTGQSPSATDHLFIDFERVVSYDTTVSDDTRAEEVFASKETDAGLQPPAPPGKGTQKGSPSGPGGASSSAEPNGSGTASTAGEASASAGASGSGGLSPDSLDAGESGAPTDSCAASGGPAPTGGPAGASGSASGSGSSGSGTSGSGTPGSGTSGSGAPGAGAAPSRALTGLGDAAFLNDTCSSPSSAAGHRTVTVVFRTSNVIVTVEYDEQPGDPTALPDSKKMQDSAQELARKLAAGLGD